jgi:hypothetical protein
MNLMKPNLINFKKKMSENRLVEKFLIKQCLTFYVSAIKINILYYPKIALITALQYAMKHPQIRMEEISAKSELLLMIFDQINVFIM